MDINMPIMDGFQAAQKLRQLASENKINLTNTKLIALSALTEAQFSSEAEANLFDKFSKNCFFDNFL